MTDETKAVSPWAFRFHPSLRRAIERDMKRTGTDRTEAVSRKLCEAYGIEYQPATLGRPAAKKAARRRVKE